MEKENYQMHGQASQDSSYWTKGRLTDFHVPGADSRGNKQPLVQMMYGKICGSKCLMHRNAKQSKCGLSRNQSSLMPENYVVSSSLNQLMNIFFLKKWKPPGESWKFPCQQQCLAKYRYWIVEKPTATLGKTRPTMLVLSMPTNLWEYDWKVCRTGITKITSLQKEKIH